MTGQTIAVAMAHLETVYRPPIPLTNDEKFARAKLWHEACRHLPSVVFMSAIGMHIKKSKFFPTPAEVIALAEDGQAVLDHAATKEAESKAPRGLHPARLKPAPEGFVYKISGLRQYAGWRNFLDTIHPTAEHFYFGDARPGIDPAIAIGFTQFDRNYILNHWAYVIPRYFTSPVQLLLDENDPKPVVLFEPEVKTEEAKARVSELMQNFRTRMQAEFTSANRPEPVEPT